MTDAPGIATALMNHIEHGGDIHTLRERFRREGQAADAAPEMLTALKLAQQALNTAPKFKVPSANTDSYKIASAVDAAVKRAETGRSR